MRHNIDQHQKFSLRQRTPALLASLFILVSAVGLILYSKPSGAVTSTDWRAGNIIDDGVFYNNNDMSTADIQRFLDSKVPTCDTNGTQPSEFGGGTRADYGTSRGYPPPFICLKNYHEHPTTKANNLQGRPITAGSLSAAQIIKNAADTYKISARALVVTLQKESPGPLVTDDWPLSNQYRNAMGYGCPDTAPCDPQFEGFYNQVHNAARQFRLYANNPQNYRHKALQNNAVYYNPNFSCGSPNVYIENKATAGLYNYTPYQPNAAALGNLYGTGDSCSAYGNRNFWRLFNDWFGATHGPTFSWQAVGQTVYTDNTKTVSLGWNADVTPGQRVYAVVKAKNTGSAPWTKTSPNPVRLGTWNPQDRRSQFCDGWISCNRATTHIETVVNPGEVGTFELWMQTPSRTGNFKEYFNLVAEGATWMNPNGMFIGINSAPARYAWQPFHQTVYTDNTKTVSLGWNANLAVNQRAYVVIKARNIGNIAWRKDGVNPVRLGTWNPQDRISKMRDTTWLSSNRLTTQVDSVIHPKQVATFEFWVQSPAQAAEYKEYFNLVADGKTWMNSTGMFVNFSVK